MLTKLNLKKKVYLLKNAAQSSRFFSIEFLRNNKTGFTMCHTLMELSKNADP